MFKPLIFFVVIFEYKSLECGDNILIFGEIELYQLILFLIFDIYILFKSNFEKLN